MADLNSKTATSNVGQILRDDATAPRAIEKEDAATPMSVYDNDYIILAGVNPPRLRPKPKDAPKDDELSVLSPKEAAEWYRRLAERWRVEYPNSLASTMLLHWLDGKGEELTFNASYVMNSEFVIEYLRDEVRPVFLTEKKAKLKGGKRWAGILPRIKDPSWDGKSNFKIFYEGPSVEIPLSIQVKARIGLTTKEEFDLLVSLHKFGIHTEVVMSASPIPDSKRYKVIFESWESYVFDKYDWDPTKYLTFPNPDYGDLSGVAPNKEKIRAYHSNAKRVENAKLAAPYPVKSTPWRVTMTEIVGAAEVDASRTL